MFLSLAMSLLLAEAPVCTVASHDRLVPQIGRDVCGSSLNAKGQPRAPGFLPTACPRPHQTYRIDARGNADLCTEPQPGAPR